MVVIGFPVWLGGWGQEYKKEHKSKRKCTPCTKYFPVVPINQILRVGSYPGYLSWFQVSLRSVEKCGVEILAFPLTRHIAYTTACCYRTRRDSKWRPPPSWIYYFCRFWSNVLFPVAVVYIAAKFHSSTSIGGWVIAVCAKTKMRPPPSWILFLLNILAHMYVGPQT